MATASKIRLIVAADEPALFYTSVSQAEMDLEAIDVRAGVYPVGYGPNGQVFKLEAIGDRVRISKVEGLPPKTEDLRALLLHHLSLTGVHDVEEAEPLGSLLARCEATVG